MSGRVVRSITNAKNIENLSDHSTSDNDIISDVDGNIYFKQGNNNYVKILTTETIESLKNDIKTLKSENTKLKKRIEALENADTTT